MALGRRCFAEKSSVQLVAAPEGAGPFPGRGHHSLGLSRRSRLLYCVALLLRPLTSESVAGAFPPVRNIPADIAPILLFALSPSRDLSAFIYNWPFQQFISLFRLPFPSFRSPRRSWDTRCSLSPAYNSLAFSSALSTGRVRPSAEFSISVAGLPVLQTPPTALTDPLSLLRFSILSLTFLNVSIRAIHTQVVRGSASASVFSLDSASRFAWQLVSEREAS